MATHAANGGDAVADTVVDTAVVDVDVLTTPTAVVSALDGTMPVVGSRMDLVADSGLPTADTAQLAALRIAKLQRFFGESEIPWEADPALVVRGNGVGTSTHTPDAASCRNDGLDGGRQTDVDSARRVWLSSGLSAASMAGEAGTTRSLASLASVAAATAAASTAAPPTAWGSTASEQTALRAVPSAITPRPIRPTPPRTGIIRRRWPPRRPPRRCRADARRLRRRIPPWGVHPPHIRSCRRRVATDPRPPAADLAPAAAGSPRRGPPSLARGSSRVSFFKAAARHVGASLGPPAARSLRSALTAAAQRVINHRGTAETEDRGARRPFPDSSSSLPVVVAVIMSGPAPTTPTPARYRAPGPRRTWQWGIPLLVGMGALSFIMSYVTQARYDAHARRTRMVKRRNKLEVAEAETPISLQEEYWVSRPVHWR
ncbi:hypothetical protein CXG81DRAFT_16318 [Caulochytrium protostelioides]|uniref:Cytochrome c oxidase assembly protein COX16, mitochondrial n=1 Tax=Caulochytrium protostelioides TaxID=1555241 RepID=A0A4P9XGJ1_9FUNG|nr:hypothetical protein CXG81DRAFT_16318 [Caulochytrium protostelioides]|eukprot:RKP04351.1 hypothetical protein CXG81DRAFT_16318 [Caulochytrium protostelioides]